jgi:DNA-binding SARP family transcriptional activator
VASPIRPVRLLTLGQLALLDGEGRSLVPQGSTKLLGLLAFIASAPGRRATREHLIDLLWDDVDLKRARPAMRQAVHRLRLILGTEYLPAGDEDIVLTSLLVCDRDEFVSAIAAGDLDGAIGRYGGDFIPGFVSRGSAGFEHWRDRERDRLRGLFAAAAETVGQRALSEGSPRVAITLAGRLLAEEPLNERAWRLRLRAEHQAGSSVLLTASIAELRRLFAAESFQPEPRMLQLLESLEHPTPNSSDSGADSSLLTDLVGRAPVLSMLYAAWQGLGSRRFTHVHIIGGAGLGKSRLLDDFAVRLRADRARVVRAKALPRQRFVPGSLLASVVGGLIEVPGAAGVAAQTARILLPVHPGIAERFPGTTPLEFADPDARFLAILGALQDLMDAISHEGPCCLLLDDAHWWDDQSRQLIEQLLDRLEGRPILVITASRQGHGVISCSQTQDLVGLPALTRDDVLALLQSLGDHPDAPMLEQLANGLTRATGGVPLLVLEAIRLGLERGMVGLSDRQWSLDRSEEFLAMLHPGRLLDERLAFLTEAQRHTLLTAWFLELPVGQDDFELLEVDAGTIGELERHGFLQAIATGWIITHDAIGEAAESSASPDAQARAHRAAGLLATRRGTTRVLLAQALAHFLEASAWDDVISTATTWFRQCREARIDLPALTLLRQLTGPEVPADTLRRILATLPADLQRRWWGVRRLAPAGFAAICVLVVSGWLLASRPAKPNAILSVVSRDGSGGAAEWQIHLDEGDWIGTDTELAPRRVTGSVWTRASPSDPVEFILAPPGGRWAASRVLPEGSAEGPTGLVVLERDSLRTVGGARGDDVSPSWSPDGRQIAFSTTRWSAPDNPTFNLAVLDVASGTARQLTDGPNTDESVHWSPDGSRIAFTRRSAGTAPDSLCWIAVDGLQQRCRGFGNSQISAVAGWLDQERVLVTLLPEGAHSLISAHLDGGSDRELDVPVTRRSLVRLSPDGTWGVHLDTRVHWPDSSLVFELFSPADPSRRRSARIPRGVGELQFFWRKSGQRAMTDKLTIAHVGDTLSEAVPSALLLGARDQAGRAHPIHSSVVRWTTSDSAVARVDSRGVVVPIRAGRVTITASAGGWRTARREFEIRPSAPRLVWEERWDTPWRGRWIAWGTPEPILVPLAGSGNAMLPNGDTEYSSGLVSVRGFDARGGLAIDVELRTPITNAKWQFLDIGLRLASEMSASGPSGNGCSVRYPANEGGQSRNLLEGRPVDPVIHSGKPYRLRLQVFPDGSCGIAINGRAFTHDLEVRVRPGAMHVALGGETVGSRLLIGNVTVWTGVPGGVDWAFGRR